MTKKYVWLLFLSVILFGSEVSAMNPLEPNLEEIKDVYCIKSDAKMICTLPGGKASNPYSVYTSDDHGGYIYCGLRFIRTDRTFTHQELLKQGRFLLPVQDKPGYFRKPWENPLFILNDGQLSQCSLSSSSSFKNWGVQHGGWYQNHAFKIAQIVVVSAGAAWLANVLTKQYNKLIGKKKKEAFNPARIALVVGGIAGGLTLYRCYFTSKPAS